MDTDQASQVRVHKLKEVMRDLLVADISYHDSQEIYKKWAETQDGSYDQLHDNTNYTGVHQVANKTTELFPKPDQALVLDLGAGTGLSGELLREKGFTKLHALEPLPEFAAIAEGKKIYQKILKTCIGMDSVVNAPNETYDAVVAAGSFGPGCIPCDALHEVVRILKPGGYFVNGMRKEYMWTVPEYKDRLEPLTKQLEREGKWRKKTWDPYPKHFLHNEGLLMVFQKC